jgi:hypothetical protein
MPLKSYRTRAEKKADRDRLHHLIEALDASRLGLRVDQYGAWRINGRKGHVYTWGDGEGFLIYVGLQSARAWSAVKKKLAFCQLTQDGECEGCFRRSGMPSRQQATTIRAILGIRRRRRPESSLHLLGQKAIRPRLEGVSSSRIDNSIISHAALPPARLGPSSLAKPPSTRS